ncbi:MAG: RHS repeat-associated core domain-containing protein [Chloroflexi bacterium]|nr:RHS repeat-associated core domain-containing protein [Chloroflexota bacterium]
MERLLPTPSGPSNPQVGGDTQSDQDELHLRATAKTDGHEVGHALTVKNNRPGAEQAIAHLVQLLTQVLADGSNTYLYGNGRIAQYQTAMQYFGADGLGSVRQLYNSTGQVIANARYDPYGNVVSQSGAATSVYGFTGEQLDAGTELTYLRARYYASAQGRFMTRDTWEGDYNIPMSYNAWLYTYGNPINRTDPSGLEPSCAKGTCGPDVTEWLMEEMQAQYAFGLTIRRAREEMKIRALVESTRCATTGLLPVLENVATESPFREIVQEFVFPKSNIPIGKTPLDYYNAIPIVEALGILEYAAYGLAVDYANLAYQPRGASCGTGGCNIIGAKGHTTATLCDQCIDTSDMGNIMFGLGGAARGYSLVVSYGSAGTYNVLEDWLPNPSVVNPFEAFFSPDGRGAIPGWLIGQSYAFNNREMLCMILKSSRIIGYGENAEEIGKCTACSIPTTQSHQPRPSSLNRRSGDTSRGKNTIEELLKKVNFR